MKIVAINGSPRGKRGSTWWVLEKFIRGAEEAGATVELIELAGKKINHCIGDFSCWFKTTGTCIHRDDMADILPVLMDAQSVVFATPVYVDGMTGLMKNFMDRLVPTVDPHFEMRDGHIRHVPRTESSIRRVALISVCGFYEVDNFDPLVTHIKAICKNMDAEFAGALLRPAAPMLPEIPTIHPLFFKLHALSKAIEKAGAEFVRNGKISDETAKAVSADIISKEKYFEMANQEFDKIIKK